MTASSTARVDERGRLIAADSRILALQQRAGGALGEALAIAPLASVARLARTLGTLISRSVVIADGEQDFDIWVRARPDLDAVVLSIGGWTPRPPRVPWRLPLEVNDPEVSAPHERWTFATDAALCLTHLSFDETMAGQPLTAVVRLLETADGDLPILAAIAAGRDLQNQPGVRRDLPHVEFVLSARVASDEHRRFCGFTGEAVAFGPPAFAPEPTPPVADDFGIHLEAALRTPLARIVQNAESIRAQTEGPLRRDYADYAGDIANAARHLLALVDDLGDLQAVERADFAPELEAIDLADIARKGAGLLAVRAADRNVRIDRPAPDDCAMARGEFRRVLQIVVNLIGNAVRYSPDGAMVWLRIERNADTAVLIVADQGKGIALADQSRIFEKFERLDPSEPSGSGLGLYISRRLARAMGGDLTVDSAPGQGARFVLTLPAA